MDNLTYLFAAYVAIWVGIFAYMVSLDSRQRGLRQEVEALKLAMEERNASEPGRALKPEATTGRA